MRVTDAPPHPDAQEIARRIHPDTLTNNMIRAALDLKRGGEHEVEIPPHTTLKEYFGTYSISGKVYRTYGGPNRFFGEIARILMEYAFVHTNPTSMPQNKVAIIIREYQGGTVDWGILTDEGVHATLESFQSGKRLLHVLAHYLTVLYPTPSTSPHCALTSPPPPQKQREKTLALTHVEWDDTTLDSPPSAARNPTPTAAPHPLKTQKQWALPVTRVEWDDTDEPTTEDVTIRAENPKDIGGLITAEPSPHKTASPPHSPQP